MVAFDNTTGGLLTELKNATKNSVDPLALIQAIQDASNAAAEAASNPTGFFVKFLQVCLPGRLSVQRFMQSWCKCRKPEPCGGHGRQALKAGLIWVVLSTEAKRWGVKCSSCAQELAMEMARRFVAWVQEMYRLMLDVLMGLVPIAALAGTCKLLRSDNGY